MSCHEKSDQGMSLRKVSRQVMSCHGAPRNVTLHYVT